MTAGNEKSAKKLVWEPPLLMRLTAPGDAWGGGPCRPGSSAGGDCSNGTGAGSSCTDSGSGGRYPSCLTGGYVGDG